MSRTEATERSQAWLEEQLKMLGGLHNATSRDSAFKTWRQNTLTVLQRIWPADPARSERFRRIVFSPPGSRPDPAQVRGMYSRGCQEAKNYLRGLITDVEANGVSEVEAVAERDLSLPHGEDDFPTVELPSADIRPQRTADEGDNDIVLDLGGPSLESPLAPEPRAEDAGAPPTLKVEVKAAAPASAEASAPAAAPPPAEASAPAASSGPERPRAGKATKSPKRGTMKQRLKDMLGLSHLVAPTPDEFVPSAPIEEARAFAAASAEPPASTLPPADVAPAESSGVFTTKPNKKQRAKRTVSIESLISPEFRNAAPLESPAEPDVAFTPEPAIAPTPEAVPSPFAHQASNDPSPSEPADDESGLDPEEFARATEDFLKNSPVLGLVGKPVQRQKDECDFLEPDAVALVSLAADVSRLGVPEGRRAAARALLLDLARHVDAGDADWATLRGTVNFAMEFPELAKRLMPVLLPWFERAA